MSVHPWVAWYAFRRHTAYPLGAFTEGLTNTVFGLLRAYILIAVWAERPSLGGYDVTDAVTFCFLTQALLGAVQVFGGMDLTARIRTGDVAIDLYRPVGLLGWWLADDVGRALATLLLRAGPPLLTGAIIFDLRAPSPARAAAFAAAFALAVLVSFALRYLVALAMFWLSDDQGVQMISLVLTLFFSGMVLPLVVFPGALGTAAGWLPWSALIQVPADVYLGKRDVAGALAFQAAWAAALLAAAHLVTRAARHRLVVQGG
ncbi:ABC transporter permease [Actinomadura flavalba]|uniref:ABC transporter permease n=1 Tax=Actinomadura flavalba TaxID=1120938 RepID=UPI00035E4AC1|nr:ABC-2 family transporter protein [Actinomadura flavalba]